MPLRRRLTIMSALVVGATLLIASVICYLAMRGELRGQVDRQLRGQGRLVTQRGFALIPAAPPDGRRLRRPSGSQLPAPPTRTGGAAGYFEVLDSSGHVRLAGRSDVPLPEGPRDAAVARGRAGEFLSDRRSHGVHIRVLTLPAPGGGAVLLGRPLDGVDSVLDRLLLILAGLCLAGTAFAAAASRLFSRPVVAPIRALTEAAEHIEATGDLARRLAATGDDEVGRMSARFNAMLDRLRDSQAALETAMRSQRQLVADASHELRTPITSLRTNIEVLLDGDDLAPDERRAVMADVVEQADELGSLVTDVIELARGDEPGAELEDVRLDQLVAEAIARAERHAPTVRFTAELAPAVVRGAPERLSRAVNNVLDNAAKYSPPDADVAVTLTGGTLVVRDHGPGVPAGELPHIFDRFYRGAGAAAHHGSGLGLAIVRQVAEGHGGSVTAEPADGGGLVVRLTLPAEDVAAVGAPGAAAPA